jgi:Tfp pilus assembly protein PilZ
VFDLVPAKNLPPAGSSGLIVDSVSGIERQHPRYAHEVAIKLVAGSTVIEGRTRNVSRGGLCATVVDPLVVGVEVEVDVTLVFDDGMQSEALRLPGRVAWCTTVDTAFQVGLSFKPLDAQRAELLRLFLKYLGEERAAKPPRETLSVDDRFR